MTFYYSVFHYLWMLQVSSNIFKTTHDECLMRLCLYTNWTALTTSATLSAKRLPVKHVKYCALGSLIIFELTVCWLMDENISQASKTLSYFCKVHIILIECSTHHIAMIHGIRYFKWRGKFVLYAEWNSKKVARPEL